MIRKATYADIPQMRYLWEQCFDDPLNFVDFIYDNHIILPEQTYVIEDDLRIVSMATALDCHFSFRDNRIPAVYLFGIAILPEYESRGFMSNLIARIEMDARARGVQMAVLLPGGKIFQNFYTKRGYHSDFGVRILQLRSGMIGDTPEPDTAVIFNDQDKIDMEEVYAIREAALYEVPHLEWEADMLLNVYFDAIAYGESMALYKGTYGASYALYGMQGRSMYIREILGTNEESTRVLLAEIVNQFDPRSVKMRLPIGAGLLPFEGVKKNGYGMSKSFSTDRPLSDLAPYMNLMFD